MGDANNLQTLTVNSPYETAYLILGHGDEGIGTVRVPKGCALVVDVHPGELKRLPAMIRALRFISNSPSSLLDPEENYEELTHQISGSHSLAIYKEGDLCPNFKYTLFIDGLLGNKIRAIPSGLRQYPFNDLMDLDWKKSIYDPAMDILSLYEGSIIPTQYDIKSMIRKTWMQTIMSTGSNEPLEIIDILPILETSFRINIDQSELFNMVLYGTLRPGVFYNLICRFTSDDVLAKANEVSKLNNIHPLTNTALTPFLSNSGIIGQQKRVTNKYHHEALKRINETLTHRKPYIRKMNEKRQTRRKRLTRQQGQRHLLPLLPSPTNNTL